jgi:hypothetical protein
MVLAKETSVQSTATQPLRLAIPKQKCRAGWRNARDIEKETVDFRPNYENTRKEPSVLPAAVPYLF